MFYKYETIVDSPHDIVQKAFICAASETFPYPLRRKNDAFEEFVEEGKRRGGWDIVVTCNGVELDFLALCKEWEKQIDRMVREEAIKLLGEEVKEFFSDAKDAARQYAEKIRAKLNLPAPEEDYE